MFGFPMKATRDDFNLCVTWAYKYLRDDKGRYWRILNTINRFTLNSDFWNSLLEFLFHIGLYFAVILNRTRN